MVISPLGPSLVRVLKSEAYGPRWTGGEVIGSHSGLPGRHSQTRCTKTRARRMPCRCRETGTCVNCVCAQNLRHCRPECGCFRYEACRNQAPRVAIEMAELAAALEAMMNQMMAQQNALNLITNRLEGGAPAAASCSCNPRCSSSGPTDGVVGQV